MTQNKITFLILTIFTLLGGYSLAQEFGESPPLIRKRSTFYPQMPRTLSFDHKTHQESACTSCHSVALTSTKSADNLIPTMKSCEQCHSEKSKAPKPKISECSACHTAFPHKGKPGENYKTLRPQPMVLPRKQSKLRFNHAKHLSKLSKKESQEICTTCHQMGGKIFPHEETCITCHTEQSALFPKFKDAKKQCQSCHPTSDKTKRIDTRLSASTTLRPNNHETDWIKRHGLISRSQPDECASCHVENECAKCHNEQVAKPFSVHPPNFLAVHSFNARGNLGACSDCHNSQGFCTECHSDAKVTTLKSPPSKLRYHPPGWLDASTSSNHGINARRNITECASCHQERDCISCHNGINPHPSDFVFGCRQWLEADSRPCAKCHQDLPALAAMCR